MFGSRNTNVSIELFIQEVLTISNTTFACNANLKYKCRENAHRKKKKRKERKMGVSVWVG